jgi:hypothetical protein
MAITHPFWKAKPKDLRESFIDFLWFVGGILFLFGIVILQSMVTTLGGRF